MKSILCTFLMLLFTMTVHSQEIRSFQKEGRYGFSKNGKTTISPEYDYAFDFKEGLALVKKGNYWGFIDEKNTPVIPFTFDRCSQFTDGFSLVMKNGKFGIVDNFGKVAVPIECDQAEALQDNYCLGGKNGKYALFLDGNRLTEFAYDQIKLLGYGYFSIKNKGRYGVIDSMGKELIEPKLVTRPYAYSGRDKDDEIYFTANLTKGGSSSYFSQTGELVLDGDAYDLQRVRYPSTYAATKDGMTKVVDVSSGEVILPLTEVTHVGPTWRPCDGFGYSSTPQLFFQKPDSSYLMISLENPSNTANIPAIPTVFEEFLLVQKKNGLYDIYNHDAQLLLNDARALLDDMGNFNSEQRICSIQERNLIIWKDGFFAEWSPESQSINLVKSGKIGGNFIFKNSSRYFQEGNTVRFIAMDENHFIFSHVSGTSKTVFMMKDNYLLWEMDTFSVEDTITLKKIQYETYEDGDAVINELQNVVLKVNGKKQHYGW